MLALLMVFIVASSYVLVNKLNANVRQYTRGSENLAVLNAAKAALLGYAVNYPLDHPGKGPGYLPCPDINTNGKAGGSCSLGGNTTIGRLPWRTLKLDHLRDTAGETLWYAVADNFRSNPALDLLNSETPAQFTLDGNTDIAALIIAPGAPVGSQDRDRNEKDIQQEIAHYLESENSDQDEDGYLDGDFIAVDPDPNDPNDFNDIVVAITRRELMQAVEKRVLGEIKSALLRYKKTHHAYPWLSAFADPKAVARLLTGTAGAGSDSATLKDDGKFNTRKVAGGDVVYNLTDGSIGLVSSDSSVTESSLGISSGLSFDKGDKYVVIPKAMSEALSGTATGGDNKKLVDNDNPHNFKNIGIAIGDVIDNVSDGSSAVITAIYNKSIEVDGLTGGSDNQFQVNDNYVVRNNYGKATNAAASATELEDDQKNFKVAGIRRGDIIRNLTDGSFGRITEVQKTSLTVDRLEFGKDNKFESGDGDYYTIARFNATASRQGHLSLHEVGEVFLSDFELDWNITVNPAGIKFNDADLSNPGTGYIPEYITALKNYVASGTASVTDGYCIWSVPAIAECYGRFTQHDNLSGRLTSGSNTTAITDTNADFNTAGVKRGDIVQHYSFGQPPVVVQGEVDAGTTGTAKADSGRLVLEDSGNDFEKLNIAVGDTITKLSNNSSGTISAVSAHRLTVAPSSDGTDISFDAGDKYQVTSAAKLYDAGTNLDNIKPYQYSILNADTNTIGFITSVDAENNLLTAAASNNKKEMTFSPGHYFSIYKSGIAVVTAVPDKNRVNTTRASSSYQGFNTGDFYRILTATKSKSGTVGGIPGSGSSDKLEDTSADFSEVTEGDIIEVEKPDGSFLFGEISAVDATTITTRLYAATGTEADFSPGDKYKLYYDYVYSREHVFHPRYSGTMKPDTAAKQRVRQVCLGYEPDPEPNKDPDTRCSTPKPEGVALSGNGGVALITLRDYEADGVTEVGRTTFTPGGSSSGSLKTSNIDFYLHTVGDTADIPAWLVANDWHKLVYVAYSKAGDTPGAAACVAGTNCLTLNPAGASVNNDKQAILISAGEEINTTLDKDCQSVSSRKQNRANGTINEYFESRNCKQDKYFQKQAATSAFNDLLRIVEYQDR